MGRDVPESFYLSSYIDVLHRTIYTYFLVGSGELYQPLTIDYIHCFYIYNGYQDILSPSHWDPFNQSISSTLWVVNMNSFNLSNAT